VFKDRTQIGQFYDWFDSYSLNYFYPLKNATILNSGSRNLFTSLISDICIIIENCVDVPASYSISSQDDDSNNNRLIQLNVTEYNFYSCDLNGLTIQ